MLAEPTPRRSQLIGLTRVPARRAAPDSERWPGWAPRLAGADYIMELVGFEDAFLLR